MLSANAKALVRGPAAAAGAAANGLVALSKRPNDSHHFSAIARQQDEQSQVRQTYKTYGPFTSNGCVLTRRRKHTISSSSASAEAEDGQGLDSLNVCPVLQSPLSEKVRPFSEIPGPPGLPIIGTLWDYLKKDGLRFNKMFEVMQKRSAAYGPIYREQIGYLRSVVISDPEEYAKVIHVDGKYPNRIEMEPIAYYRRRRGMGLGTVNGQGEEWYRHRTILSKKILRPCEVLQHVGPMDETATDFVQHINSRRLDNGAVPKLEHEIFKWALECKI